MFHLQTKVEVSTITCNEEMKDNAKCKKKILILSHPLVDLEVTHRVHLWLDGKRIVDFLLVIIEPFSLAVTAAALIDCICRNRRFLKQWAGMLTRPEVSRPKPRIQQ